MLIMCVWPTGLVVGCAISHSVVLLISVSVTFLSPSLECTQTSHLPVLFCLTVQSMNPQMSPCFARHLPVPHLTCSSGHTRAVSSVATQCCSSTTYRGIRLVFTPAPPPMLLGPPLQTSPSLCSVSERGGWGGEHMEVKGTDGGNGKVECGLSGCHTYVENRLKRLQMLSRTQTHAHCFLLLAVCIPLASMRGG